MDRVVETATGDPKHEPDAVKVDEVNRDEEEPKAAGDGKSDFGYE